MALSDSCITVVLAAKMVQMPEWLHRREELVVVNVRQDLIYMAEEFCCIPADLCLRMLLMNVVYPP